MKISDIMNNISDIMNHNINAKGHFDYISKVGAEQLC